ncbi:nuclear transport factor 2 family protein [Mycolicibacterium palauense]|uniref:nuclear transport factor 2 family protein n=1 Tax=Mycolicibacterium palauense TaxID=2034511 RepID=UPI000BFF1156|nr:nuclear transport factor 2 family protein [Mycolicibacterium palauense]
MTTSEIATVLAWHDALNAKDLDTLVQLSSDDIELGEADGATQGLAALQLWASKFTETVTVGRMYVHDGVVVFEQILPDGTAQASAFRVVHDQVTSAFRHDSLAEALAATDLTEDDLDA